MFKGKDGQVLNIGDFVVYEGSVYKVETQLHEHLNLRGPKSGVLISVKLHGNELVKYHPVQKAKPEEDIKVPPEKVKDVKVVPVGKIDNITIAGESSEKKD